MQSTDPAFYFFDNVNAVNNDPLTLLNTVQEIQHAFHANASVYKPDDGMTTISELEDENGHLDARILDELSVDTNQEVQLMQVHLTQQLDSKVFDEIKPDEYSDEFKKQLATIKSYANFNYDIQKFIEAFLTQDQTNTKKFIDTYNKILRGEPITIDKDNIVEN